MAYDPFPISSDEDGNGRVHAVNLAEAFRAHAGLVEITGGPDYRQAYLDIAQNIDDAHNAMPDLAAELEAGADQLLALLLRQREEAYRRYVEAAQEDPYGARALQARRALDALNQAVSRAVLVRDRQEREAKDPARRAGKQSGPTAVPDKGRLPSEAGETGRRSGEGLRRDVYDSTKFDANQNIEQQARTATTEQLAATEDKLRASKGQYGPDVDAGIDAKVIEVKRQRLAKDGARAKAERYAEDHYGVDAGDLERHGPYADGLSRDAADPTAAKKHVDEAVRSENAALGDRKPVKPGGAIPPPLRAGRPPQREQGAGPRGREERIAAQTAEAVRRQVRIRKEFVA
ncbi:MAG TPA: hypothetical protein VHU91_07660 [Mycobacteriales bacterium]|nr:hypothetical protein [Mycobacteriales bacterium]